MCTQLPSAPLRGPQVCPQDINVHSWKTTEMSPRGTFSNIVLLLLKKKKILFIYFERERKGEREGEKHQCVVVSPVPPTGDLARNLGMCPGWASNQ